MTISSSILFDLTANNQFGNHIEVSSDMEVGRYESRTFLDGEHKTRPLTSVRDRMVFVTETLFSDSKLSVNDRLCRLLFFIAALKEHGAAKVVLVAPYLCFSRKDRKTKYQDPITNQYVARLFEAMGVDQIVTVDVHNLQAYENAYRIPTVHLQASKHIIEYMLVYVQNPDLTVLSPDGGGIKRAIAFSEDIGLVTGITPPVGMMYKSRKDDIIGGSEQIYGTVAGRDVIIVDDMVSSGGTLIRAAKACKAAGANKVFAAVTHGVFTARAHFNILETSLDKLFITNTLPDHPSISEFLHQKVECVDITTLVLDWIGEYTKVHYPKTHIA